MNLGYGHAVLTFLEMELALLLTCIVSRDGEEALDVTQQCLQALMFRLRTTASPLCFAAVSALQYYGAREVLLICVNLVRQDD